MQKLLLLFFSLLFMSSGYSQVTITGPACVLPGIQYQYHIGGQLDSSTSVQVCVTGGVISGTSDTCITDTSLYQVLVTWNSDSITNGVITVTVGSAVQTLTVVGAPALSGGAIDSALKVQFVDSAAITPAITCSPAIGGACNASFLYQWQQSPDNLAWSDIDSATNENLSFSVQTQNTMYYRRRVLESTTGTIAFSDVAVVFIKPAEMAYLDVPGEKRYEAVYAVLFNNRKLKMYLIGTSK